MKTQVELESLQEQLRVRKEKQYQLLEKLQGQEEAKRQAEDQVWEGWRWWIVVCPALTPMGWSHSAMCCAFGHDLWVR